MFSHLSRSVTLRALAGATSLALAGTVGATLANDPVPPAAPVAKPVAISDVALSRAVLAAIDADPVLKDVNLIISVVDRGAVIGGPVASEEIVKRAEAVVRGVAGVGSVKNVCFVQPSPDPLLRAVAEGLKPGPKPSVAALPGVVPPPTAPEGFIPPLAPLPPSDLLVNAPRPVEALRPTLPSGPAVNVLGGPIAAPGTGAVAKVSPLPTIAPAPTKPLFPTAPVALNGSPAAYPDVPTALTALRKSARFAGLELKTMPDGGLFVTGRAATPADVWAFIEELRKVPGVTRIAPNPDLVK